VLNLARGEMPGLFDGGEHVVDARDVTAAMLTAAESGQTGERYVVAGPYVALSELAATVAAIRGVTPPRRLPYPLVAVAARLADTYGRVTGRPVPLTTAAVRTLRTTRRLDAGKATRELGATYRPFEETLRDELDWFEANGYLDETEREAPRRPVPAT
jgi:dihydroflavonol-4-reductase